MEFDEAWPILQEEAINKITENFEIEGQLNKGIFTSDEYMRLYTTVYNVCNPNMLDPSVQKMYDHYKKTFEDYISSKVLPSLRGRDNEDLLRELLTRWNNHTIMRRWLFRLFHYLQRYHIPLKKLPSLEDTSNFAFFNLVYGEMNDQVCDAIASLVNRERQDEPIDRAMLKGIIDIYKVMGEKSEYNQYAQDFEKSMLEATSKYYSRKASEWISSLSYDDYVLKVEQCLEQEKSRVSNYLTFKSNGRVVEVVHRELLKVQAGEVEEMKQE